MTDSEAESSEDSGGLISVMDSVETLYTGVPAPLRRGLGKALAHLCTSVVNYPATLLNNAAAERVAESQGRIKLVQVSASKISQQLNVPTAYVDAASVKFAERIVREQKNIDRIAQIALEDLRRVPDGERAGPATNEPPQEISEDWLNAFDAEAVKMSSENMQMLFAKILAGEVRRPSTFSVKTLRTIAQLDAQTANIFKIFCSLATSLEIGGRTLDRRVAAVSGGAASNGLQNFGLPFAALNVLFENGLIISDYNSYINYHSCVLGPSFEVQIGYAGRRWALRPTEQAPNTLHVHGVQLTKVGLELSKIVDINEREDFTIALRQYFLRSGVELVPLDDG